MAGTRFALEVQPRIPKQLNRLNELANNLLYSWEHQIIRLFVRLDPELWAQCEHNPKVFLRRISQRRLEEVAQDRVFMEDYNRALSVYDTYLSQPGVSEVTTFLHRKEDLVAYFCAEFGIHESFPIYSGGLGILAGDHCKAASDLDVPFVAVGMLYRQGYFNQTIDESGKQHAIYTPASFADLPISPATDEQGREIHVSVPMGTHSVGIKVWKAHAGHINLVLLDTDLETNNEKDRRITYQLYGGDKQTRIQQEIVLGIGGVRALRALKLNPNVWHINEGHAAFMLLERTLEYQKSGLDFNTAWETAAIATVFTTHTPVPAGHDIFPHELMTSHFEGYYGEFGISEKRFLELGSYPGDANAFNQTALALRGSRYHNGVSRIHGGVASKMENYIWPQIEDEDNPIDYVTNGVHVPTFLARHWVTLFDNRLGAEWRKQLRNEEYWNAIDDIPDHVYWATHQSLKVDLFEFLYKRAEIQHRRNGCSDVQIEKRTHFLNPENTDVLVVGFARRFATYKRAALLFADLERLARLVNDKNRPVVLVFAGKAHPKDEPGQELIKLIYDISKRPEFEGKIIVQEGYDIALARKLVAGVDVWLNNPEYPLEASGTSGQKAGINGVINLSVLDGWWGEGYVENNGWAIKPHGPEFSKQFRDHHEAQDLLNILENQVIPLYYSREPNDFSREFSSPSRQAFSSGWVKMSKASMKTIIPHFNAERMMMDYVQRFYSKAAKQSLKLYKDNYQLARELADWKQRIVGHWKNVKIRHHQEQVPQSISAGTTLKLQVAVTLDGLNENDIIVESIIGTEDDIGKFNTHECQRFKKIDSIGSETIFELELCPSLPGLQYYKIRCYPYHANLSHRFEMGCMLWL
ncbi:MAG: alpha-glucan family phosphorylase [Gammaproteobacteria bacterium]|nr:alpha-glucan family phosphorylase [Gammaproteobacteria bacterium]